MPRKPWPPKLLKPGEILVKGVRRRSHLNACIGPQLPDQSGLFWYADGYRQAARRLVDEFVTNGQEANYALDTVVYPIVFLYRHHFELMLKRLLRELDLIKGGKGKFPAGHKLGPLWSKVRASIEPMFKDADWGQNALVDGLIDQFDAIDADGQTARYPRNSKGTKAFENQPLLNVEHFAELADRLGDYLEAIGRAIEAQGSD